MKLKQKKKKNKKKRGKVLLETSIQIDKFLNPDIRKTLDIIMIGNDMSSSYYCLFEFKTGLIRNMIDFYSLVNLSDTIDEALAEISDKIGRANKNVNIMQALIFRLNASINTRSKKSYLRKIEAAIFFALSNFKTDLKNIVGDFGSNDIVKFDLGSADDYDEFITLCNNNNFIKLEDFLNKHINKFEIFLSNRSKFQSSDGLRRIYEALEKIESDLPKYANKHNTSRGIGDAVIAMDLPRKYKIMSLDQSFNVLCPLINRGGYILKKNGTYTEV